jgi:hypothetical protein
MGYGNSVDKYFILRFAAGLDLTGCRDAKALAIEALRLHFREEGYRQSAVDSFNEALQEFISGICDWDDDE